MNGVYQGYLVKNQRHGPGIQIWSDNTRYEGEWKQDKMSGYGTYFVCDFSDKNLVKIECKGSFKNNVQDGEGEEKWLDGTQYKGLF